MRRTLLCLAFVAATCAVATAQVVQLETRDGATDVWARYFNPSHKETLTGRISGICRESQSTESGVQITLLVSRSDGGETTEVELGPDWYVDQQEAKPRVGDQVQVTGSNASLDGRSILVASQVLLRGQGGPVLSLRRLNGKAYWVPTEAPVKPTTESEAPVATDEVKRPTEQTPVESEPAYYPPTILHLNGGQLSIDTGGWYGSQNSMTRVTNFLNVVSGPYPFFLYLR